MYYDEVGLSGNIDKTNCKGNVILSEMCMPNNEILLNYCIGKQNRQYRIQSDGRKEEVLSL